MKEKIKLTNIYKSFTKNNGKTLKVLEDINFTIKEGELLALLGPSGSGKTTLLRIIAGLEEEASGSVDILKDKKKDLKEVSSNTKNKAKESLNVEVNLDEIKETTKVIKDKVKDLPSEALDTIQTKVIDKVQDAATDYAVSKAFKGNFFKRLIESVINKLKKI